MPTHTLTVENWRPTPLNRLLGGHWARAYRLKKADKDLVAIRAKEQGTPPRACKRRVSIRITYSGRQKAFDADNCFKSLLDSLVACGLLVDDSPEWCELGTVTQSKGNATRTIITLEDLDDE